mgnify:CR=1 FL=1
MDDLDIAKDRADWLLDAIAGATQNRQFLRGDPAYDEVAGKAILLNGEKAINVALSKKDAEITRLRAALADAQAVGFAAGVEAAAKVAVAQAVYTRETIERATGSELVSNLVTVTKSKTAHDIETAIRALTPTDATAAAARVLLADEAAMNTLSDYEHRQWAGWFKHQLEQSTPENIERWKRQADMPFTLLSDDEKAADRRFADAALRAIAGDTP